MRNQREFSKYWYNFRNEGITKRVPMNEMDGLNQCFHLQSRISQVDYNCSGCSRSLEGLESLQHVQTPLLHMRSHSKHRYSEPKVEITLDND